jgi:glycosyltransferase involved in cell wall biosynthesis
MPAYNEQATIIRILELVAEQVVNGIKFEVIVIDDCSTDNTVNLVQKELKKEISNYE